MSAAEDPLRYIRKYLNVDEDLTEELTAAVAEEPPTPKRRKSVTDPKPSREKPIARPIPTDTPAFLRRPYNP